jgi:hypothetical protein
MRYYIVTSIRENDELQTTETWNSGVVLPMWVNINKYVRGFNEINGEIEELRKIKRCTYKEYMNYFLLEDTIFDSSMDIKRL